MIKYFTFLSIIIPCLLSGQSGAFINYGDNLLGELPNSIDIDIYQFEGNAGDRIWIRATDASSPVDASFRLKKGLDILYQVAGRGGHVELFDFMLPETGIYDIEFYDMNFNDTGAYGLSLHRLNNPTYAEQIQCGDDISGAIETPVGIKVFQLDVQAGDQAFTQMRAGSPNMEATMYLFNQNGDLLRKSVRKANPFAFISAIDVPEDDRYALFLFDANGNDLGSFGLTYQDLNDPDCGGLMLDCKDHKEEVISQLAEIHAYSFDLEGGQGMVAKALSPSNSMELTVGIFDPEGKEILVSTVSGKANDIVIPEVALTGRYTMLVYDDRANDIGAYSLSYNKLDISCAEELVLCHEMVASFETLADLNLYYFFLPSQSEDFEVKEIDAIVELHTSLIYQGIVRSAKDNVKLKIEMPDIVAGNLVFLAISDNGGNDLGRYKMKPLNAQTFENTAPVAICKENLTFVIPSNGVLELSPEDLDHGSYDDCQIVEMFISPSTFDCAKLGNHQVTLTVIDNHGLSTEATSMITIATDLSLLMNACHTVPIEQFDLNSCINLVGAASGGSGTYTFNWSNGTTGQATNICPADVVDFGVEVVDANGCTDSLKIWIPLGDNVICHPNGKKVTICHRPIDNPDAAQSLCVNVSSLSEHYGHGDLMGSCNNQCSQASLIQAKNQAGQPETEIQRLKGITARTGEELRINLLEMGVSKGPFTFELINTLGQSLSHGEGDHQQLFSVRLPDNEHSKGLYYLIIRQLDGSRNQITMPIMVR